MWNRSQGEVTTESTASPVSSAVLASVLRNSAYTAFIATFSEATTEGRLQGFVAPIFLHLMLTCKLTRDWGVLLQVKCFLNYVCIRGGYRNPADFQPA